MTSQSTAKKKPAISAQEIAIQRSLRETIMMTSYSLDEAKALLRKQLELLSAQDELETLQATTDQLLGDPQGQTHLHLYRNQVEERVKRVRSMGKDEKHHLDRKRQQLEERRTKLKQRKERLIQADSTLANQQHNAQSSTITNRQLRKKLDQESLRLHSRHAHLLRALEDVFPIDLIDGSSLLFSITGIPLPNGVAGCTHAELDSQDKMLKDKVKAHNKAQEEGGEGSHDLLIYHPMDDDTISTALGLVAQLVILLNVYLGTPVHYPMATAGSRAVVQDGISIMSGPRAFPLYSRGVERYRYEYAAFLLNKNIEQLMNVHNVTVLDIRHTLPNLKNLIVTVSSAPPASMVTRKKHIGRNEISLLSTKTISPLKPEFNTNGDVAADDVKKEAIVHLGLGRPQGEQVNGNGVPSKLPDAITTTRVLGKTAPPETSGSAIESVTRALSFLGSRPK